MQKSSSKQTRGVSRQRGAGRGDVDLPCHDNKRRERPLVSLKPDHRHHNTTRLLHCRSTAGGCKPKHPVWCVSTLLFVRSIERTTKQDAHLAALSRRCECAQQRVPRVQTAVSIQREDQRVRQSTAKIKKRGDNNKRARSSTARAQKT